MSSRQNKLTGEEVGRLILKDLATIFKNTKKQGDPAPTLSADEKFEMVNSLTEPSEVAAYNEYRYFHEFLSRASLYFNVHQQSYESRYWQIMHHLETLYLAERENHYLLFSLPKIMTPAQRESGRSLFNPGGELNFGRGVAVAELSRDPKKTPLVDKNGHFMYPWGPWRAPYRAEGFLKDSAEFAGLLASYRDTLREALVIKAAVEIIGRFLGVPELSALTGDVDLNQVGVINDLMEEIPYAVHRRGMFPGERHENELRDELRAVLQPVDVAELKPSAKARAQAKRAMDFSVARGNSEKIYSILRQETDE